MKIKKGSDQYTPRLRFSKSLGFKSCAEAIMKLGQDEFKRQFNLYVLDTPKKTRVRKPERDNPLKYTIERKESGGVPLLFDNNYLIFPDGKVWTIYNKKLLIPKKRISPKREVYYTYQLRGRKQFHINKLVYLHFGKSSKTDYGSLNKVINKDGNPLNFSISNLKELK